MIYLPKKYTKKHWERNSIPEYEQHIGKPMISYSQITSWLDKKGFNTGREGWVEYIRKYFLGEEYPDMGWSAFGNEVEAYICKEEGSGEAFTVSEKKVLDSIEPLGTYQTECIIDFNDFIVLGFIDDSTEDLSILRDYKTASKSSSAKYYTDEYIQLLVYALFVKQKTGKLPEKLEVVIIERLGGAECFRGGGRACLSVGNEVWKVEKEISEEKIKAIEQTIRETVSDISEYFQVFQLIKSK